MVEMSAKIWNENWAWICRDQFNSAELEFLLAFHSTVDFEWDPFTKQFSWIVNWFMNCELTPINNPSLPLCSADPFFCPICIHMVVTGQWEFMRRRRRFCFIEISFDEEIQKILMHGIMAKIVPEKIENHTRWWCFVNGRVQIVSLAVEAQVS